MPLTEVSTRRSGLWLPNAISPLQSPKMLNEANIQLRFTMFVFTRLTTFAAAYASPVRMIPFPSSVSDVFSPVAAETSTFVFTTAMFVDDATNADAL